MLVKCYSASSNTQIITRELCNHDKNSTFAKTHAQDICVNLTNLHIATWKGTIPGLPKPLGIPMATPR